MKHKNTIEKKYRNTILRLINWNLVLYAKIWVLLFSYSKYRDRRTCGIKWNPVSVAKEWAFPPNVCPP